MNPEELLENIFLVTKMDSIFRDVNIDPLFEALSTCPPDHFPKEGEATKGLLHVFTIALGLPVSPRAAKALGISLHPEDAHHFAVAVEELTELVGFERLRALFMEDPDEATVVVERFVRYLEEEVRTIAIMLRSGNLEIELRYRLWSFLREHPLRISVKSRPKPTLRVHARQLSSQPSPAPSNPPPDPQRRELEDRVQALSAQLEAAKADAAAAQEKLNRSASEVNRLTDRLQAFPEIQRRLYALEQERDRAPTSPESRPLEPGPGAMSSWDQLLGWAKQYEGAVLFSKKAVKAARSSPYIDFENCRRAIQVLAEDYVPTLRGDVEARKRLPEALAGAGITVGPTGAALTTARYSDSYFVMHGDKRLPLDNHIQGSSIRDPRYLLRIYFHFYEAEGQEGIAIIGHLPTHLPNYES